MKRKNLKRRRQNLQFVQAPSRIATWEFGQAVEVPNTLNALESRYFVTEAGDTAHDPAYTADTIPTRPLGNPTELLNLCQYAFTTYPDIADTSINPSPAGVFDAIQGTLWWKGKDIYTIRNQTNESVTIQAYYCHVRKDWNQNDGQRQNVYRLLGRGFAERGLDSANAGAFNRAMFLSGQNPFASPLFCRVVKIVKSERFSIAPGKVKHKSIRTKWRTFHPIDLVTLSTSAFQWASLTPRYDFIKGEKFILFKLFSGIGMPTGQPATNWDRNIGQTDPLVIMATNRRYYFKHMWQPAAGLIQFTSTNLVAGDDVVVMGDSNIVEQKEAQAE